MIVQDNTDEILKELQQKQLAFVTAAAELVQSEAKELSPVAEVAGGNLRRSIKKVSYVEDGIAIGEVGPTADYAIYLEYGTYKMKAQPYMKPGYDNASKNFDRLKELLKL
jgi:HK97 gp10 family phage protein